MTAIAVVNESTRISDAEVQAMLSAFETQWNRDLRPVWRVEAATLSFVPKGTDAPPSDWLLAFLDNSDQAGALAYHDLTNDGLPLSKIFVETILEAGDSVSVAASHELCEMAVDPWLNGAAQDSRGRFWACEVADPVEHEKYGYFIGGVRVTDFVTPAWFGPGVGSDKGYDFKGHLSAAWQVASGGYAQYFDPSRGWTQVGAAKVAQSKRLAAMRRIIGKFSAVKR